MAMTRGRGRSAAGWRGRAEVSDDATGRTPSVLSDSPSHPVLASVDAAGSIDGSGTIDGSGALSVTAMAAANPAGGAGSEGGMTARGSSGPAAPAVGSGARAVPAGGGGTLSAEETASK